VLLPLSKGWADSDVVSQEMSNGVTYCAAFGNNGGGGDYIYYDSGSGNNRSSDATGGELPATWTHSNWSGSRWGVYCTYEAGGTGPAGVKTLNDLAIASVKTINDVAIANVKTINDAS